MVIAAASRCVRTACRRPLTQKLIEKPRARSVFQKPLTKILQFAHVYPSRPCRMCQGHDHDLVLLPQVFLLTARGQLDKALEI